MDRDSEIEQRLAANVEDVMLRGPRLSTNRSTWIVAKDGDGYVCVGGLGSMGVGEMWMPERDHDRDDPTYADAPIRSRGWPYRS